jgi:rhodanese-related sulfurtransferase
VGAYPVPVTGYGQSFCLSTRFSAFVDALLIDIREPSDYSALVAQQATYMPSRELDPALDLPTTPTRNAGMG